MESETQPSFIQAITGLFRTLTSVFHDIKNLIALEIQLAKKSVVWIVILSVLIILFAVSAWFCFLATLVAFLVWLKLSWLLALIIVTAFNIIIIIPLVFIVLKLLHYLTFPATRQQLGFYKKSHDKINHETTTKKNPST